MLSAEISVTLYILNMHPKNISRLPAEWQLKESDMNCDSECEMCISQEKKIVRLIGTSQCESSLFRLQKVYFRGFMPPPQKTQKPIQKIRERGAENEPKAAADFAHVDMTVMTQLPKKC